MLKSKTKLFVGLSGGVDSIVLLDILVKKQEYDLTAIHINHNLQTSNAAMQKHCELVCERYGIRLITKHLTDLHEHNNNLEQRYRQARYAGFTSCMPAGATIALAHHADDQFETRVKRIMTASSNISGMQQNSEYHGLKIFRPLLGMTKQEILSYAKNNNLTWVDDPSNLDIKFERNFIRHNITPVLQQQWPGALKAMNTFAEKHANLCSVANEVAESDLANVSDNGRINIRALLALSPARRLSCWQAYLEAHGLHLEHKAIKSLLTQAISGNYFKIKDYEWLKHKDSGQLSKTKGAFSEVYTLESALQQFNIKQLNYGNLRPPRSNERITIRFRIPGQSIEIHNKKHKQKLKKLMQEWLIPPYLRDSWPIIYYDDKCACIPNHAICKGFYQEQGIEFLYQHG